MLLNNTSKLRGILFLMVLGVLFNGLNAQSNTTIFVSTDASEWSIDGRLSTDMIDSTLAFIFDFDEDNPPLDRPDTVYLDLLNPIDLSSCDSVYIRYSSMDDLPSTESWVAGDVQVLVSHPGMPAWTEIYDEDLSYLAGWVNSLNLRLKVAVRSNPESPGTFKLFNVHFTGSCNP